MSNHSKIRTYSELLQCATFDERYNYLKLDGKVGVETFGFERYLNQNFYRSPEWKKIRDLVIIRDCGCDLAVDGYIILGRVCIHHMNPIDSEDIRRRTAYLMDPEYLITCSYNTHQAIHYGCEQLLPKDPIERRPNDTCPWKQ